MKKWIRWWGLGLFAAIVLLLWLTKDLMIKNTIEFAGTQAVGAKVELDRASLTFSPAALTLERLQVTNPDEPMQNMFEAGQLQFALDGFALLRRQFVAETLNVEGMQFNTPRERSGAIKGRLFSRKDKDDDDAGFDISSVLPGLSIPDTDAIVAAEKDRLQAEIDATNQQIKAIEQGWETHIASLPDDAAVAAYRERWRELQKANPLQRAAGIRELKRDIDRDLESVRSLDDRLKNDRAQLTELSQQARNLPARESQRLLAATGLDGGFEGLTRQLLGERLSSWVSHGLTAYQLASEHMAGAGEKAEDDKPPRPPRGEGVHVRFPEQQPLPRFLIKQASISGIAGLPGQQIDFSGTIDDITNEPGIWGKPMSLLFKGASDTGATLDVSGNFDHRGDTSSDRLDFNLKRLGIENLVLSESRQLPISLQQGLADISGGLAVRDGQLQATVKTLVQQAKLQVEETTGSSTAEILARALQQVSQFNLDLGVSGTPASPSLSLNSNLDRIIGQAIGGELKEQVAEARADLEAKLQAELAPKLGSLDGGENALDAYQKQVDSKRDALRDIIKGM